MEKQDSCDTCTRTRRLALCDISRAVVLYFSNVLQFLGLRVRQQTSSTLCVPLFVFIVSILVRNVYGL